MAARQAGVAGYIRIYVAEPAAARSATAASCGTWVLGRSEAIAALTAATATAGYEDGSIPYEQEGPTAAASSAALFPHKECQFLPTGDIYVCPRRTT
jgi:hypothetical protein